MSALALPPRRVRTTVVQPFSFSSFFGFGRLRPVGLVRAGDPVACLECISVWRSSPPSASSEWPVERPASAHLVLLRLGPTRCGGGGRRGAGRSRCGARSWPSDRRSSASSPRLPLVGWRFPLGGACCRVGSTGHRYRGFGEDDGVEYGFRWVMRDNLNCTSEKVD